MVGPWAYGESILSGGQFGILILIHHIFDHCCDIFKFRVLFVKFGVIFLHFLIISLTVFINNILRDKGLVTELVINFVLSTWHIESWGMKGRVPKTGQYL